MTQTQIHNLAMNILLDTQDYSLIWTIDWSQGDDGIEILTDQLTDQGQRMLDGIKQHIINALNQ